MVANFVRNLIVCYLKRIMNHEIFDEIEMTLSIYPVDYK